MAGDGFHLHTGERAAGTIICWKVPSCYPAQAPARGMTYNFDPDRWLTMHLDLLEERRRSGDLDEDGYRAARHELERRHEVMLEKLDGTYRLPDTRLGSAPDGDGSG